jgi:hypothetical protein
MVHATRILVDNISGTGPFMSVQHPNMLEWTSHHVLLSVSVCSNVPIYTEPICFVTEGDTSETVESCLQHLTDIPTAVSTGTGDVSFLHVLFLHRLCTLPSLGLVSVEFLQISFHTLSQYLKAYKCTEQKGFFPYEWMTSLDKLNVSQLPPHEAFYSTLKNENISAEDYQLCQTVWEDGIFCIILQRYRALASTP